MLKIFSNRSGEERAWKYFCINLVILLLPNMLFFACIATSGIGKKGNT